MIYLIEFIKSSNSLKLRDCIPSDSAFSGSGCTSTIIPSAPTANAPIDIGFIKYLTPVPWDGSTTTGSPVSFCIIGTAAKSNVFLV